MDCHLIAILNALSNVPNEGTCSLMSGGRDENRSGLGGFELKFSDELLGRLK